MAGVEHSEEVKVTKLAHGTGGGTGDGPVVVGGGVEVVLGSPLGGFGPGLTTSPVANPILITGVDENLKIAVVEHIGNLGHEVGHPVSEEVGVDEFVALNPLAAGDSKSSLNVIAVKENVRLVEIVTEGRGVTWNTDVVHVELGMEGVSNDGVSKDLAELKGGKIGLFVAWVLLGLVDEGLAGFETTNHNVFPLA